MFGAAVNWRLAWAWRVRSHPGSLIWLLAESLSALPRDHLFSATENVLTFWGLAFPRVSNWTESKMEASVPFMSSKVTRGHWCAILLVTQVILIQYGRGPHKSVSRRRQISGFLDTDYPLVPDDLIHISLTFKMKYTHSSQGPSNLIPIQRSTLRAGELGDI